MWDVVLDALLDTLKLFPFLFVLYILIELLEHKTRVGKANGLLTGRAAPLVGAATGLVPMCGFSVMSARLYRHRHITLGTLLAVFIATSDEAFFVLILSGMPALDVLYSVLALCGLKILFGAGVGYVCDAIVNRSKRAPVLTALPAEFEVHSHRHDHAHDHEREHEHRHEHGACEKGEFTACEHGRESTLSLYLISPLLHALQIAGFILVCNLLFGFLFYGLGKGDFDAGKELVVGFLQGAGFWYQPLVCCLVGLIPNCASSVAITETFALGGIAFGSCLAGLIVNAGLGYLVLLKDLKQWKRTLAIAGIMIATGIVAGYCVNAVALAIGV